MKKIGIDIRCLMESRYSGISEYTINLLDSIFKLDRENQYFLFYNSRKKSKLPEFKYENVIYRGFNFPNKLFNLSSRFLKLFKFDRMIGGVDIFLAPNFLFLNLSKNCKKILVIHDLSFELFPQFFTVKARLWHKLIGPKKLASDFDQIIAISQNTKKDIISLYRIPDEKIRVIYPAISDIFFQEITEQDKIKVKDKYHLPDNYLFYLGNLEPRKNIESLLLAFDLLDDPNLSLVIAGGQAWKYKNIYKLWQSLKNKKRIKFLGYVDQADKPALYALAKIFVYPSIYEGFGLPPVEAMALGTPVISGFNSSLLESVGDQGLLLDPNNFQDLASGIRALLEDNEYRQKLSEKGKIYAAKFRWSEVASEFVDLLNKL